MAFHAMWYSHSTILCVGVPENVLSMTSNPPVAGLAVDDLVIQKTCLESGVSTSSLFSMAKGLLYCILHAHRIWGLGLWQIGEWSARQSFCSWPQWCMGWSLT